MGLAHGNKKWVWLWIRCELVGFLLCVWCMFLVMML